MHLPVQQHPVGVQVVHRLDAMRQARGRQIGQIALRVVDMLAVPGHQRRGFRTPVEAQVAIVQQHLPDGFGFFSATVLTCGGDELVRRPAGRIDAPAAESGIVRSLDIFNG